MLTLKVPVMTAADDSPEFFSLYFRQNKTFQTKQDLIFHVNPLLERICMKHQALFSSKDKS